MEKIKRLRTKRKKKSLKWSFIPYMVVMAVAGFAGMMVIGLSTNHIQDYLTANFAQNNRDYRYDPMRGDDGTFIMSYSAAETYLWNKPIYKVLYEMSNWMQYLLGTLWVMSCLVIPGILFYRLKLKKPLTILMAASSKISENDLDFKINYSSKDEMGALCRSFEKMRSQLEENNLEMWRQMDERKRLNAAFSHDLRTPLTVLKGQSDMIIKYAPDDQMDMPKVISTVETMKKHIERLENYTYTMNRLQKLEDIEINKRPCTVGELLEDIKTSGKTLCKGRAFNLMCEIPDKDRLLDLDIELFMQVFENLISNAVRFAKTEVSVTLGIEANLYVIVHDDGPGFEDKMLMDALKPFASTQKQDSENHFGIGLSICKILCEKHGGYIKVFNKNGGAVKAIFNIAQ